MGWRVDPPLKDVSRRCLLGRAALLAALLIFFRPQAIAAVESIIQDMAGTLGRDAYDIRQLNAYGPAPRDTTPYGQIVREHVIAETFDELRRTSDYDARRDEIARFNAASPAAIKGIAMTAVKFGISFTTAFLNQGNALVNVYYDGSIQVSTGHSSSSINTTRSVPAGAESRARFRASGIPWRGSTT